MALGKWIGGFLGLLSGGPLGMLAGIVLGAVLDSACDENNYFTDAEKRMYGSDTDNRTEGFLFYRFMGYILNFDSTKLRNNSYRSEEKRERNVK